MIFAPPTQHALRALIFLANQADRRPLHAREIAVAENIPAAFLSKILHRLRARGFLRSIMGPGGGYVLAKPAHCICVRDIVEAFDDAHSLDSRCLLGIGLCGEQSPCPLHEPWEQVRASFSHSIATLTLQDIATSLRAEPGRKSRSRRRKEQHGKR